jgi:acetyl-CoA carboxylase carboxyl transferase subunit alpha
MAASGSDVRKINRGERVMSQTGFAAKSLDNSLEIIRHSKRPNTQFYIEKLFPDFIELSGDRLYGDDLSIIGGIGTIAGIPITIIGNQKGRDLNEHIKYNFSMSKPEGYRKVLRLMKQAEKFHRPVVTLVDTLGAYPGREAEERGQGAAIANCLMEIMNLKTPIVSVLLGDGGSGGALALCIADVIIALQHATLSVIAPRACANILWKDSTREKDAAAMLKMNAQNLSELGIVDKILPEPTNGAHMDPDKMVSDLYRCLVEELPIHRWISHRKLVKARNRKYAAIGQQYIVSDK